MIQATKLWFSILAIKLNTVFLRLRVKWLRFKNRRFPITDVDRLIREQQEYAQSVDQEELQRLNKIAETILEGGPHERQ